MNSNRGIDPMLSSFVGDSMWNTKIIAEPVTCSLNLPQERLVSPVPDILLSPVSNPSYSDLEFMWGNERKRVTSIKIEEDETFTCSPCSIEEADSSEIDMEECDIKSEMNLSILEDDGHDMEEDSVGQLTNSFQCKSESNTSQTCSLSEADARKCVESIFSKIAFIPNPNSSHREKIRYILSKSDCKNVSVDDIISLDKRSAESARVCAKIVQNIPQRYRWECVKPEEIPCCYTIVADCKKSSSRDKPPRPMNAFMIWAQGARRLINELCPKMQNAAISEALGYYWRQKTDSFKKRFEMEKLKLRRFHNVEFPQYKYKPKTKIQKAKEKKELSLSKCKVSKSAIKREQLEEHDQNTSRRKSKYGRPRKVKQTYEPEPNSISKSRTVAIAKIGEPVKSPPSMPAIKDMLTLKILNDRRSKEITNIKPNYAIQSCLGQLSPLEVENPISGDTFDELRDYEGQLGFRDHLVTDGSNRFTCSSVYDTPANTPPIDENDHPFSPIQTHTTTLSSSSSPVPQEQKWDPPNNGSSRSQLSPRETMPSLKAILSSGSPIMMRQNPQQTNIHLPRISVASSTGHGKIRDPGTSSDVMLSFVSEILRSPNRGGKPIGSARNVDKDRSNNPGIICDVNNNCTWQQNKPGETHQSSGDSHSKPFNFYNAPILDFNDLDTLSLDLNVPLLSDDDMKSLLNTL